MFCRECGKEISNDAVICVGCGVHTDVNQTSVGMRLLLPVGRSAYAIAAGYLGLFSILLVPAPFAIILGIIAIKDIKKHKNKHGLPRAIFGITMGALIIVIYLYNFLFFSFLNS